MLAVVLALASSVTWGVSDFLGGLKSRSLPVLGVLLISQGSALVLLVALVAGLAAAPPDGVFLVAAALGGLGEAIGVAALYRGLGVGMMSIVAPVAATAPVVPVAVGAAGGEVPAPAQWVGIATAIAGIVLVSRTSPSDTTQATAPVRGISLGVLAAVGFGSSFVGTDVAAEADVGWALLVARITTVTVFVTAAAFTHAPVAVAPREVPILILIGFLVLAADTLFAVATTRGLLGAVAVLGSLFPVITILLAHRFLHERMRRPHQAGALLCLVGAVLVTTG